MHSGSQRPPRKHGVAMDMAGASLMIVSMRESVWGRRTRFNPESHMHRQQRLIRRLGHSGKPEWQERWLGGNRCHHGPAHSAIEAYAQTHDSCENAQLGLKRAKDDKKENCLGDKKAQQKRIDLA